MNHEILFDAEAEVPQTLQQEMERVIRTALEAEGDRKSVV